MKLDRSEIIWSIPIIVVLIYLIYYGFRARDVTNICFKYCASFGSSGYKIDGSIYDAFVLNEDKIYCICYYSFGDSFVSTNKSISYLKYLQKIGGDLSGQGIILPFR